MLEETQPHYHYVAWPAWRYGPNGEAAIFEEHDVIPEGWTKSPNPEKSHEEEKGPDAEAASEAADAGQEAEEAQVARRGRPPKIPEGQF